MCDPECRGGAQCLHNINNGKFSCYCNKGLHYIGGKCVPAPTCNPGCKGGGVCIPEGRKPVCSCSRGLSYTGQGCAKCEAAPRGGAKKSRDIPLDGGWIDINCGTGGCITLHKAMAGCSMRGDQTIHIPKVAHCKGKQTCNIKPTSKHFGVSCNNGWRRMWITWSCNSGRDRTTHHIPKRPTCRPGCKGGSVCNRVEGKNICTCQRGLSYTGQGCAKCEAAPRGGAMKSRDIPLDGGWININCGTGGCITLHKVMAGCSPGANIHIHKVAHCKGKQTCNIKPTSAQFGVNCNGWRRMWITWSCNSGRDRTTHHIPPRPTCRPGCKGGSVCKRVGRKNVCSCNRGLSYTGQGCAKCEAAPRGGEMISRDIPLDGGWININCGTGGCITLHKVMAGCRAGANKHIPKVAHCEGKQTCNIKPTSAQFGVSCSGFRRMWITWSCNSGRDKTTHHIPPKPSCKPGCRGGSICKRVGGKDLCSCNNGLTYTGQGCAKCEAAPRGGAMKSNDIPLDGGWININSGTGGCITLHKVMAGCRAGPNIHIPKVAHCKGKQTCNIKPTSKQFGVSCSGWRRMWITWSCNSGRDRSTQYKPKPKIVVNKNWK